MSAAVNPWPAVPVDTAREFWAAFQENPPPVYLLITRKRSDSLSQLLAALSSIPTQQVLPAPVVPNGPDDPAVLCLGAVVEEKVFWPRS